WWDNTIIPLEDSFADEIETQLFPAFGLDAREYRIVWDRSKVAALQDDEEQKHATIREDYKAGVIDLYTASVRLGLEADEALRGVRHPSAAPKSNDGDATKSWELKYDPNQPRDERGRWTSGSKARTNRDIQRYCEEGNESYLARKLGGKALPDSE